MPPNSPAPRFVVGIDLGTTHCAVAYASLGGDRAVRLLDLPQLIAPGEVAARPLLPSFLYLPAEGELPDDQRTLPWGPAEAIVGELARQRGAQVPNRLVASAKSWICHGGVNRRAPILPWSAPDGMPQVSPFEAQVDYLRHLRAAWDAAHPNAPLADQDVVVTVPASFDEVARELTVEAAREAGLATVRLIEEPQAAFYDFLGAHADDLAEALGDARLALVIDVGGGTTDLTLVRIAPGDEGAPALERIAVGGHLMLGGDNMDAALAHHALTLAGMDAKLDPTEWSALVQSARQAKEALLAADAPEVTHLSIQKRGRRLIGGTRTVALPRDDVRAVLLDGFVPATGPDETAQRTGRAGLTTLGLPYTSDPAIPRHVCAFLRRHAEAARAAGATVIDGLPRPDLVLLNGGVFNAPALVERLTATLDAWFPGAPIRRLDHTSLDTAVARGAARFALTRHGVGATIGGGAARAYYVGVEGPGGEARAFCVAPKGMQDGSTVEVTDRSFQLVLDRRVAFPLYGYTGDRADPPGRDVAVDEELDVLPPLETVLRRQGDLYVDPKTNAVPVRLSATLTEAGTLELYLATVELPPRRWRLAFDLAGAGATPAAAPEPPPPEAPDEPLPARFPEARRAIERAFGGGKAGHDPQAAKALRNELEAVIGPRGQWSSTECRGLADALLKVAPQRGRTPEHELQWLRILSWCARPGFGHNRDRDRMEAIWALFAEGLQHPGNKGTWNEWWILWRRVAAGLDAGRQATLYAAVAPWLGGGPRPKGPHHHGPAEMLRLLAALERLPADAKQKAGAWLQTHFKKINSWWPLGRLGARQPFHGTAADVVPPDVADAWLELLLPLDWSQADGAAFAAACIARVTGDAARDLPAERRRRVADRLTADKSPSPWIEMVTRAVDLSEGDTRRVFGDSLPAGLRLR